MLYAILEGLAQASKHWRHNENAGCGFGLDFGRRPIVLHSARGFDNMQPEATCAKCTENVRASSNMTAMLPVKLILTVKNVRKIIAHSKLDVPVRSLFSMPAADPEG